MTATNKPGRPAVEIDLKVLKGLCVIGCTNAEIAAAFSCSERTIEKRRKEPDFLEAMERGDSLGCISLRRKQHRAAMRGNTTLLIWLGKQRLGQKDKIDHSGDIDLKPPKIHVHFLGPRDEPPPPVD